MNIEKGIETIDEITDIAVRWMNTGEDIAKEISDVFFPHGKEKIKHYINKWNTYNNDFGLWYLSSTDEPMRRTFFDYYGIPLEKDKYKDTIERFKARASGKRDFEIFPFESHVVNLFFFMANNNPLDLLLDIAPEAFTLVKQNNIDLYGNGINWIAAWRLMPVLDKEKVLKYCLSDKNE